MKPSAAEIERRLEEWPVARLATIGPDGAPGPPTFLELGIRTIPTWSAT